MPTPSSFLNSPGAGPRHSCGTHSAGATELEALLEATKVASMFGLTPREVVILRVHGTRGPGATVRVSEAFRTITEDDPANTQAAAYLIGMMALLLARTRWAPGGMS